MHVVLRILATVLGTIVLTALGIMAWHPPDHGIREFATRPTMLQIMATPMLIGLFAFAVRLLLSWRFIR